MENILWCSDTLPTITLAGHFPMPRQHESHAYNDPFHALLLVEYEGAIRMGSEKHALMPGDIILMRANVATYFTLAEAGSHTCIHFLSCTKRGTIKLPKHIRLGEDRSVIQHRLWSVIDLHRLGSLMGKNGEHAALAASAELHALLLWLTAREAKKCRFARNSHSFAVATKCMMQIESHYADPLNVIVFAGQNQISPNHLSRMFHLKYKVGILRALTSRRIEVARRLLSNSHLSVKEIGAMVGFPDAQHFNKRFRQATGLSPSTFRSLNSMEQALLP